MIDTEAIEASTALIGDLEQDIEDLIEEAKVDRALMHAEMDTKKAEDAIFGNKGKSGKWFRSKEETSEKRRLVKHTERLLGDLPPGVKPPQELLDRVKNLQQEEKKRKAEEEMAKLQKKKQKKGANEEPKDNGNLARKIGKSYKKAVQRGEIDERAELIKSKMEKKRNKGPKESTFERKMREIETEVIKTGNKKSKNKFKSAARYNRRR